MTLFHFLASIPALFGLSATVEPRVVSRVTIEQTTIFRIPVRPHNGALMFDWQESKGPKCLPTGAIAGVMLSGPKAIDFVMRDRQRVRARIGDDCAALDFYSGIYLQPEDDRLCAKRDEIRSRMGASCRIEKFRTLTPVLRR